MKGKFKLEPKSSPDKSLGGDFYAGGQSEVAKEAKNKAEGFKRGGKAKKHVGKVHGEHAEHHAGRKPRMSGGKVLSSASSGTMRAKSSHY
ncbi:hypothetical protein UFOVP231_18 [uncultured Caudovirales phage]|uniref:Uncharacterized protein n=1 Tax=uncultured Caudovirales phage TaxID=2100421 RepID=A0A6J7WTC5_9CAUD|nr:hypothetical protein UFOVP231_18 [uncultured Caudovirales phage]